MTNSKNMFFSEDEIEAVDMEIETLLLARKRQESRMSTVEPDAAENIANPSVIKPVASRPATEAPRAVISNTYSQKSSGVLPQQRLTKTEVGKETPSFRISCDGETLWPEMETTDSQRRHPPKAQKSITHRWWVIATALFLAIAAVLTVGHTL